MCKIGENMTRKNQAHTKFDYGVNPNKIVNLNKNVTLQRKNVPELQTEPSCSELDIYETPVGAEIKKRMRPERKKQLPRKLLNFNINIKFFFSVSFFFFPLQKRSVRYMRIVRVLEAYELTMR